MNKVKFKEISNQQKILQNHILQNQFDYLIKIEQLINKLNQIDRGHRESSNPLRWQLDNFTYALDQSVLNCNVYLLNVSGTLQDAGGEVHLSGNPTTDRIKQVIEFRPSFIRQLIDNILSAKPESSLAIFQLYKYLLLTTVSEK